MHQHQPTGNVCGQGTSEQACYQALLLGEHGDRVRLEQERIRFSAVEGAAEDAFAV